MKENSKKAKSMDQEPITGVTAPLTLVPGPKTKSPARVTTPGLTVALTKGNGSTINYMVMECMCGLMVVGMRETTSMIRKRAGVSTTGLMAKDMRDSGRMENNMEKGRYLIARVNAEKVYGKTAREFNG